jgi:hypothetical protein
MPTPPELPLQAESAFQSQPVVLIDHSAALTEPGEHPIKNRLHGRMVLLRPVISAGGTKAPQAFLRRFVPAALARSGLTQLGKPGL